MRYFFSEPWGAIVVGAAVLAAVLFAWDTNTRRAAVEAEIAERNAVLEARERELEVCGPGVAPVYQNGAIAIWPCE